jgi:hypothetical protein
VALRRREAEEVEVEFEVLVVYEAVVPCEAEEDAALRGRSTKSDLERSRWAGIGGSAGASRSQWVKWEGSRTSERRASAAGACLALASLSRWRVMSGRERDPQSCGG